jgi:hypothetical protein
VGGPGPKLKVLIPEEVFVCFFQSPELFQGSGFEVRYLTLAFAPCNGPGALCWVLSHPCGFLPGFLITALVSSSGLGEVSLLS